MAELKLDQDQPDNAEADPPLPPASDAVPRWEAIKHLDNMVVNNTIRVRLANTLSSCLQSSPATVHYGTVGDDVKTDLSSDCRLLTFPKTLRLKVLLEKKVRTPIPSLLALIFLHNVKTTAVGFLHVV